MSIVLRFEWYKYYVKPISSMLIGVSPELEIALYTLCYLTRAGEDCRVRLADYQFFIRTGVSKEGSLRFAFFDIEKV